MTYWSIIKAHSKQKTPSEAYFPHFCSAITIQTEHNTMKQDLGFYIRCMRISIGIIYIWFGALKFFPHISPAEDLAQHTIQLLTQGLISGTLAVKMLAVFEVAIGFFILFNIQICLVIMAMLGHILCTLTPALILPDLFFTHAPYGLTLVGQYIIKNTVFIFAALLIHRYQQLQDKAYPTSVFQRKYSAGAESTDFTN